MTAGTKAPVQGDGLRNYYKSKIEDYELRVKDKSLNLKRLEAQRNELNTQGKRSEPTCQRTVCYMSQTKHPKHHCTHVHAFSPSATRGAATPAGAWIICWGGCEGAWV